MHYETGAVEGAAEGEVVGEIVELHSNRICAVSTSYSWTHSVVSSIGG